MINVLRAEFSRWVARRGLWMAALALLAVMGLFAVSIWFATRPPSGEELDRAKQWYAEAVADWEINGERYLEECLADATTDADREGCQSMRPEESHFVAPPMSWKDAAGQGPLAGAVVGSLGAMLMAASFWGAEYRQGSLSTWLTFVPGRGRVWGAKMGVAAVAGALVAFGCAAVGLLAAWVSVVAHQGPDAVGVWTEPVQMLARAAGLGAVFAVIGGALAVGFRNTVAAVALPLAYLLFQGLFRIVSSIPGAHHLVTWMPENNVIAYLRHGYTLQVPLTRVGPTGVEWSTVEKTITFGQGLLYLVVIATLCALASWVLFRRRDIAE